MELMVKMVLMEKTVITEYLLKLKMDTDILVQLTPELRLKV
jgi:hypothetical protein